MDRLKPFYLPSLLAIVLLASFFRLGAVSLFDVDEAVFSQATKEMVQSGDWITPKYDGENRFDKPILFYWLMAASYKAFGINEFGARFPSALAGFLLVIALYFFTRKVAGEKKAFLAALSFSASLYFFVYSHAAVTDMVLTFFITLSLFSFFLFSREKSSAARRTYVFSFYLFSALAFLTKGLIGIIFPFGIAGVYLFATERSKGIRKLFDAGGIVLFVLVSAPWYAAQLAINGREFFIQFFIKHHFERYFDVISGHRGPIYYYIPMLIVGLLPWIAFLPAGIMSVFADLRTSANDEGEQNTGRPGLFAFIWFSSILIFFSFSTTKLPNYILSALPAAAILIASGMSAESERWKRFSHGGAAALSIAAGAAFIVSRGYMARAGVKDLDWTIAAAGIFFVLAALSIYGLVKRPLYAYMSGLMFIFLLLVSETALPIANQFLQAPLYRFSSYARERLGSNEKIIVYNTNNPSVVFYSDRKVIIADTLPELSSLTESGKGRIVIAKTKDPSAIEKLGLALVDEGGGYALFEKK
jgi:4-amino-4-deoxy-L-arabinose transferase-like glycosyltransferase